MKRLRLLIRKRLRDEWFGYRFRNIMASNSLYCFVGQTQKGPRKKALARTLGTLGSKNMGELPSDFCIYAFKQRYLYGKLIGAIQLSDGMYIYTVKPRLDGTSV